MKNSLFILILLLIGSCTEKTSKTTAQVIAYYSGFKKSDYSQIREVIADSLTLTEGEYTMTFTPKSFYEQFKWDSVFKPVYELVELENQDEQIVATVSVKSLRFEFLKNNPLTGKHKFHFKAGKINRIESFDFMDVNWEIWQKERDSLISWVKLNHPELDGFINDLSKKGAVAYLSAIELYKKHQVD